MTAAPPSRPVVPVEVHWYPEGPPPREPRRYSPDFQHAAIARELRARPGVWAHLPRLPLSMTNAITSGSNRAYRPGGTFEAKLSCGMLFARYVGDTDGRAGEE